ncbi:hypothetical protein [Dyella telluris]|uniref:Uncharacterized protein n=1 Tax=Dyella telluris TaxID=2763498 RepID=A0A7G8Q9M7_9GAMM|nr:hypothetical protein [Dyella telluris]QNK03485.1 hypothetical protein H8F01_10415 [Dyella telluris]
MLSALFEVTYRRDLCLQSGPATIVPAAKIRLLKSAPRTSEGLSVVKVTEDERVLLFGDFSGFHLYVIVTHTKFRVDPSSVRAMKGDRFSATVYCEPMNHGREAARHSRVLQLWFKSPVLHAEHVEACAYGNEPNGFAFHVPGCGVQKYFCDMAFVTGYSTRPVTIPANIEYIGMSARGGSEVHSRFQGGHDKLESVLSELVQRQSFCDVSILVYKPGELEANLAFHTVVEILEAGLIGHFKPKHNTEHRNFPSSAHKLTGAARSLGANGLKLQLEAPKNVVLYSDGQPLPRNIHDADYDL